MRTIVSCVGCAWILATASAAAGTTLEFLDSWGSFGYTRGQFDSPCAMAVGQDGLVYVINSESGRVQQFTPDGVSRWEWGRRGAGPGAFEQGPTGVAVDKSGLVYVLEPNGRVQKFTPDARYVSEFWGPESTYAWRLSLDEFGNCYIGTTRVGAEQLPAGVHMYDPSGLYVRTLPTLAPYAMHVDDSGALYVTSAYFGNVKKFDSSGALICARDAWDECGGLAPHGIAGDADGGIVLANGHLTTLHRMTENLLCIDAENITPPGDELTPAGIVDVCTLQLSRLYALDEVYYRVLVYRYKDGGFRLWCG